MSARYPEPLSSCALSSATNLSLELRRRLDAGESVLVGAEHVIRANTTIIQSLAALARVPESSGCALRLAGDGATIRHAARLLRLAHLLRSSRTAGTTENQ